VVFAQENGSKIYSINTDGTRKRVVLSKDRLSSFDPGTRIDTINFVPHTHLLFFVTVQCNLQQINSPCPTGAFLADTDTGDIKKIGDFTGTIEVSPDGKMLAVGAMDGMKIFTLDGRLMRDDILPYTPSHSDFPFPTLSWLPDSSGLIVAIPDKTYNTLPCGPLPAHSIWRYTLAGNTVVQIPLEPSPMDYTIAISPDGNWIAYGGVCQPLLYLGNLVTGQTQIFGQDDTRPSFSWSSDSKHLIIHYSALLTSLDKPSIRVVSGSIWWLDAHHFGNVIESYISFNKFHDRNLVGEIRGDEIFYYEPPGGDFIPIIMKAKR
jgi:WD40 repeat protein